MVHEVVGAVQRTVEDAIAGLTPGQQQKLRARSGWHLICGVFVMVVQALGPFAEADQQGRRGAHPAGFAIALTKD